MSPLVAPSILSADFSDLKKEIASVEKAGADWIHIDVMDGMFVPNITIGPVIIKSIRKHTSKPFDVHLMIEKPERYIENFVEAGANLISVHPEVCIHLHRVLKEIHNNGIKAGVALNPHTPLSNIKYILDEIDLILIMTVNPGFGGQKFIHSMVNKIKDTKKLIKESGKDIYLEVDGGISIDTGELAVKAGANVLVSGNSIFTSSDRERIISYLKSL
ncbi:MAG: ribulose-phosphate 3-epimerase [Cyanobacteriota bacterium]